MTTPPTPANWYPDPEDPNALRYWDGNAWTEHRAPASPPQPPAAAAPEAPSDPFAGSEQATSIVKLPSQSTPGTDQPGTVQPEVDQPGPVQPGADQATSIITTRSADPSPSAESEEPKPGAHRAPDEGVATQAYDASQGQPSWGAPPPAAPYDSTQMAPSSYGAPPTQFYENAPSYGAPAGPTGYGAPPSYPPFDQSAGGPQGTPPNGSNKKVLFGVIGTVAALILIAALVLVYFFVIRDDDTATTATSNTLSSQRSSSSPSSEASSTSRRPTMTTPTEAPPGPNPTIADYIAQNGIQETAIQPDDPTAPPINIPIPTGWENVGAEELPAEIYGGAIYAGPELADDPPQIQALYVRLVGPVDPQALLALAPGELNNLPGFVPQNPGQESRLSGFPAYQLAGTYDGAGGKRLFAQKTAVIPADDGTTYVLQLNVEGPEAANDVMIDATAEIDDGTTIG